MTLKENCLFYSSGGKYYRCENRIDDKRQGEDTFFRINGNKKIDISSLLCYFRLLYL